MRKLMSYALMGLLLFVASCEEKTSDEEMAIRAEREQKDAMAARGYFQAFQDVKASIKSVLEGENPGEVVENEQTRWYRELFAPSVAVGLVKASDLAGYRNLGIGY